MTKLVIATNYTEALTTVSFGDNIQRTEEDWLIPAYLVGLLDGAKVNIVAFACTEEDLDADLRRKNNG